MNIDKDTPWEDMTPGGAIYDAGNAKEFKTGDWRSVKPIFLSDKNIPLSRSIGKYFGANISARVTKCDKNIIKYLGITLLPQAGVALGMAMKAVELGPEGNVVRNITLFAVLIYEIVGPFLTKVALTKAGDIDPTGRKSLRGVHPEHKENTSN